MADIYEILLDEENKDPIVLVSEDGRKIAFEQIAVIPYNEKLYCILKPVDKIENVADYEAIVFFVDESGEENSLKVETDGHTVTEVFEQYYDLLDEEISKFRKGAT